MTFNRVAFRIIAGAAAAALCAGCSGPDTGQKTKEGNSMPLEIKSSAFDAGGTIPKDHTADGPDRSPPLSWSAPPQGTKSLALICDDPDAPVGTWVHWVLW